MVINDNTGSNSGKNEAFGRSMGTGRGAGRGTGTGRVNCGRCKFFYVTWDPAFPRGCRLYGFKTKNMPCFTVLEAIGRPCTSFVEKK